MVKLTWKKTYYRKGLAAIYRQKIIQDVTLFTSQSADGFYDKLFSCLDFTLPQAATGRRGFPKEAMVCAFIVMKCEGYSQITDLADYLDNSRLIAHYCGFNIMKPLPSYWTYDRFLKKLDNGELKEIGSTGKKALRTGHCGRLVYRPGLHARCGEYQAEQSKVLCRGEIQTGKPP